MRDLAGLVVTREQFDQLAPHCKTDHRFPGTWEAWTQLMAVAVEDARAAGLPTEPALALELDHFV